MNLAWTFLCFSQQFSLPAKLLAQGTTEAEGTIEDREGCVAENPIIKK